MILTTVGLGHPRSKTALAASQAYSRTRFSVVRKPRQRYGIPAAAGECRDRSHRPAGCLGFECSTFFWVLRSPNLITLLLRPRAELAEFGNRRSVAPRGAVLDGFNGS